VGQVDQAQAHSNKHMCVHALPAIMAVRACNAQTHAQYQAHVCMSCQHAWHAQPCMGLSVPPRVPGTCRHAADASMPSHAAALRLPLLTAE
jgi:hypothetical protein